MTMPFLFWLFVFSASVLRASAPPRLHFLRFAPPQCPAHSGNNGPASGFVKNNLPGSVGMNVAGSHGLGPC